MLPLLSFYAYPLMVFETSRVPGTEPHAQQLNGINYSSTENVLDVTDT